MWGRRETKHGMSSDPHPRQSMRAFLATLERAGELLTVSEPVACEFGIGACLAEADNGPALYFAQPEGPSKSGMPLVGNLLNSLPRFAAGLTTSIENLQARLGRRHRIAAAAPGNFLRAVPGGGSRSADACGGIANSALFRGRNRAPTSPRA